MSSPSRFTTLSELYSSLDEGGIPCTEAVETLIKTCTNRDDCLLYLSVIRKIFTSVRDDKSSSGDTDSSSDTVKDDNPPTTEGSRESESVMDLRRSLLCRKELLSNLVGHLDSSDQLVSFTACKALVSVLGSNQWTAMEDKGQLKSMQTELLSMIKCNSLTERKSVYCFQVFTELLKHLRKPLQLDHPALSCCLCALKSHWTDMVATFRIVSTTHSHAHPSSQPSSSRTEYKRFKSSLGEFLSLTVELLRYHELCLSRTVQTEAQSTLTELYYQIVQSLQTLTTMVCSMDSLYLVKRLLDALLKVNRVSFERLLDCSQSDKASHPHTVTTSQPTHPHNLTASQPTHPHDLTASQPTHPHDLTASHATHPPNSTLPQAPHQHNLTASHPLDLTASQLEDSSVPTSKTPPQQYNDITISSTIIHHSLSTLLHCPLLSISFQHWIGTFVKMAGLVSEAEEAGEQSLSVEDGLKGTIIRKACLLVLEYSTAVLVKDSQTGLSAQALLSLESVLQSIVSWAWSSVPPTLAVTLGGLLQDDVESTGVDFLRLLFYSILTEQDDCLVRALQASVHVHNCLYKYYDSLTVEAPLLHLALGVFNIHTLFVKFLSGAGFDSTMLLDLVMSPETNFSHFLASYLEIVIREKRELVVFNYDLQSACAELDIVEEYMSMDMSGSGEEGSDSSHDGSVNGALREQVVDSEQERDNVNTLRDCDVPSTGTSGPQVSRKRELATAVRADHGPSAKRVCLQNDAVGEQCDIATAERTLETMYSVSPNVNSTDIEGLEEAASDSDDVDAEPPPTKTFLGVVSCLVELGETLTRLCKQDLLSQRVNNVGQIVTQTEQLKKFRCE